MFQFTEIAGENNLSHIWLGNSKYPAKYQIKYEFATMWPDQYIQCTLYFETISSKLLKYVVNLLRHIYGTNVHARRFTNKVKKLMNI